MLSADQVPVKKPAFKNAMAQMGCPDRRINRLCITFLAIIAQAIRASLLASAIAATFVGRRASNAAPQGRYLVPWSLA